MNTLGFIGVGNMGRGMALRLIRAGYRVVVCDTNRAAVDALCTAGAHQASSPAELAQIPELDGLITMLPSNDAVRETYLGSKGIFAVPNGTLRPRIFIDSSTISQSIPGELLKAAKSVILHPETTARSGKTSPDVLDAPVSGGVVGASEGTLTFMVGGEDGAVETAREVLAAMGKKIVHCGPTGAGQATKLCNNAALAISMAGVAEALALGGRLGLDPRALSAVFNESTARCWSSEINNPVPGVLPNTPASRDYQNGFGAALMCKDLGLALSAAAESDAPVPMARAADTVYKLLKQAAGPTVDFSGVYRYVYGGKDASQ